MHADKSCFETPSQGLMTSKIFQGKGQFQGKAQSIRGPRDDLDPEDEEEEQIDDELSADLLNNNISPAASLNLAEQLKGLPEGGDEPAVYSSPLSLTCDLCVLRLFISIEYDDPALPAS